MIRDLDGAALVSLARFLRSRGPMFAGGSVSELIDYLIDERLSLRVGGSGHAFLADAGAVILAEAETERALLEDRLEFYKHQEGREDRSPSSRMIFQNGRLANEPAPSLPRRESHVPAAPPAFVPGSLTVPDMR